MDSWWSLEFISISQVVPSLRFVFNLQKIVSGRKFGVIRRNRINFWTKRFQKNEKKLGEFRRIEKNPMSSFAWIFILFFQDQTKIKYFCVKIFVFLKDFFVVKNFSKIFLNIKTFAQPSNMLSRTMKPRIFSSYKTHKATIKSQSQGKRINRNRLIKIWSLPI